MTKQNLRELAKEHAQGNLDRETYKKSRAELIQGILSSEIPLAEIDYPPLVQPPEPESLDDTQRREDFKKTPPKSAEPEATTSPKPSANASTLTEDKHSGPNKLLLGALALTIVAVLVVAVLAFSGKGKDSATAASQVVDTLAKDSPKQGSVATKSEVLIKEFLARKNWSVNSLNAFTEQWQTLSKGEIPDSQGNLAMGQLSNAIYKQFLEEQALSGLVDDDSSVKKQQQLIEFSKALGISDSRLKLADDNAEAFSPEAR